MAGSQQLTDNNGQAKRGHLTSQGKWLMRTVVRPLDEAPAEVGTPAQTASALRVPGMASSASFAGTYTGERMSVTLSSVGGGYSGTIQLGDQEYPLTARDMNGQLEGKFESQGTQFDFTASLTGTTLTLVSGGTTYTLRKRGANPLATPQSLNPLAQRASQPPSRQTAPATSGEFPALQVGPMQVVLVGQLLVASGKELQVKGRDGQTATIELSQSAVFHDASQPPTVTAAPSQIKQGDTLIIAVDGAKKTHILFLPEGSQTSAAWGGLLHMGPLSTTATVARGTERGETAAASAPAGDAEHPSAMVGRWHNWMYYSSGYSSSGSFSRDVNRYMQLTADGKYSFSQNSESAFSGSGRDSLGNETWRAGAAGQNKSSVIYGRWGVKDGFYCEYKADGSLAGKWPLKIKSQNMWVIEVGEKFPREYFRHAEGLECPACKAGR
jgi:hypothetical protein